MTTAYLKALNLAGGLPSGGDGTVSTIDDLMVTAAIGVTPTVAIGNAYGINYCVGGKLTFSNIMAAKGSGVLQSARATFRQKQVNGFTLFLFTADPTSSTLTDSQIAALAAVDAPKVLAPIPLTSNSQLSATNHTVAYAVGMGMAISLGHDVTTLYGALIANGALSTNFATAGDVFIELTMLQDGGS
jgi:hypothetical protein